MKQSGKFKTQTATGMVHNEKISLYIQVHDLLVGYFEFCYLNESNISASCSLQEESIQLPILAWCFFELALKKICLSNK